MGYLTPDTLPADTLCRVLFIPNDRAWLGIVTGALEELTFASSFVLDGALTREETADAFKPMFDAFCFNQGVCRVIGEVIAFAGATSPDDRWLICDGSSLLRASYPDLFSVIGTTYGSLDGDSFSIPDLRGRSISGVGTGSGLTGVVLGQSYGEEGHTLITAEIPSHTHTDLGHTHVEGNAAPTLISIGAGVPSASAVPSVGVTGSGSANISSVGGDGSHNTIGPRLGVNYLIVALS